MRYIKKYTALLLMVVFCSYYAGISMFSHTHISNGSSIVHSHLGGDEDHNHSDSQYAVIDILANFQSETATPSQGVGSLFQTTNESYAALEVQDYLCQVHMAFRHRGPPYCC
ncbi:MAG: hypothetical protein E7118_06035 [Bacteroidales bacterium]|nr:hypothetical protein [Bacteroidales bacterium]